MSQREPLDVDRLRAAELPWRRIDVVDETGSTNADLLSRAAAGEDIDGTALLAEFQSAGRGRHGRHWSAPPRSQLSLSVAVGVADVDTATWGWLPLVTGLAVVDAVDAVTGVRAALKWPNDVLAGPGPGKLAGILAEVAAPKPTIVVGLGLNVTMTAAEAPDPAATSLTQLGAAAPDRTRLAEEVLRRLAGRIESWQSSGAASADDYRARSLTLGTRVRALLPGDKVIEGVAADIDELGRLVIDTGTRRETVSAGDITHLRPSE